MSKKKDELSFDEIIVKLYYFLKYKLHFDDVQATVIITSLILLPVSAYLGFPSNTILFIQVFFIAVGIDVLTIVYSLIKRKYFKDLQINYKKRERSETVIVKEIEQIDELSGLDFEKFVEQYYILKGYKTVLTQGSHDFGADIIADKGKESIVIEAKRWKRKIRRDTVLYIDFAKIEYKATKAVIFTSSELTEQAKIVAHKKGVKVIDRYELKKFLRNNPSIKIEIKL